MKRDELASGDTLDVSSSGNDATDATIDASHASLAPRTPGTIRLTHASDYAQLTVVEQAHYTINDELARGGMGRIVRAHDRRLGRDVAIKELLPGHDDIRFEREARITARLAHPAIVAVHEAGRWPSGEPFFAMKLVAGMSLDKKLAATNGFTERLALVPSVLAAVDALAYAHSEKVIHRDLKPANILVGNYGETVVIDWGLAKDLASDLVDDLKVGPYRGADDGATVVGSVMGTPAYMPPEQAEGERVDERADVYALGALLYHVIAGAPPYEAKTVDAVLAQVLAGPPKSISVLAPESPIELVAIVERAMARDKADRFPTAQQMADELRRFQTGQLVQSHRYTAGELVRRWLRRHRAPVAVGGIALATLAVVGIASVAKIVAETHRADREAQTARERADRGTLERAIATIDSDPTAALATLSELSPGAPEWRAARTLVADARARGTARVLHGDGTPITELAWSADGAYLAALAGGEAIVWDLATGVKARLLLPAGDDFRAIAWDRDQLVHTDWYGRLGRWQPMAGIDTQIARGYEQELVDLAPGGRWVATFDGGETGALYDVETGTARSLGPTTKLAWDADGETLLVWHRTKLRRVDPRTLQTVETIETGDPSRLVASMHGRAIYPMGHEIHVGLHSVLPLATTNLLALLPDGRAVYSTSRAGVYESIPDDPADRGVDSIVAIADGSRTGIELRGHRAAITAIATSLTGQIASADYTSEVRIWTQTPVSFTPGAQDAYAAFLDPDRRHLVIQGQAIAARLDLATGARTALEPVMDLEGPIGHVERLYIDRDRRMAPRKFVASPRAGRWAVIDYQGRAWQWDVASGGRAVCDDVTLIAISADGATIATYDHETLHLWDAATGEAYDMASSNHSTTALAVSPDHQLVAAGELAKSLVFYRDRLAETVPLPRQHGGASALAFDASGEHLAAAFDTDIYIFTLATNESRLLRGHDGAVLAMQWDGDRLISTSVDATVRIWNVDGSVHVLRGHTKPVISVDLRGDAALTVAKDGTARLWDIASEVGRPLLGHDLAPVFAGFGAAGELLVLDGDGRVSHYRDDTPPGEAALRVWIAALTN